PFPTRRSSDLSGCGTQKYKTELIYRPIFDRTGVDQSTSKRYRCGRRNRATFCKYDSQSSERQSTDIDPRQWKRYGSRSTGTDLNSIFHDKELSIRFRTTLVQANNP